MENTLYYGDNLKILREYIPDNSIDLIYLDPPFKSGKDYNILFKEPNGTVSKAQIRAFEDTWHWGETSEETFHELVNTATPKLVEFIKNFRSFLGENDMMAYLTMMAIRLVELKRVLKKTGSICLHCDPTASHYLKILMDIIFLPINFRNEIIWHYRTGNISRYQFQRKHDVILFYSKGKEIIFNPLEKKEYYSQLYGPNFKPSFKGRKQEKDEGGFYRMSLIDDVWDISAVFTLSKEHLPYPTQKPLKLLKRIIKASSNEGSIVLDPFCGCGTTIDAAIELKRKWLGIDITHLAIALMKHRIEDRYGKDIKYKVVGEPEDFKGAYELAKQDRYQFQWWALSLVKARPLGEDRKKGADRGIDGVKYFQDGPNKKDIRKIIIQVKSGHVGVKDIRELITVTKNSNSSVGVFITLENPTEPMKKEAISEGYYTAFNKQKYPKIQILTIEELLNGKNIEYLNVWEETFKKAKPYFDESQKGEQTQFEV